MVVVHGGIPLASIAKSMVEQKSLSDYTEDLIIWERDMIFGTPASLENSLKAIFGDKYLITGHTAYKGPYQNPKNPKWYMIDTDFRGAGLCAAVLENDNVTLTVLNADPKSEGAI